MSTPDYDRDLFRQSARRISVRMGLVSAGMVLAGAGLFFFALWWKTFSADGPETSHYITVSFDIIDLVIAVGTVGVGTIVLATAAAFYYSREATAPLAEAMTRQRNFIADASHELRTPLSVMHLRVQQLQILARGDARIAPVAQELRADTQAMADIVDDLLAIASGTVEDAATDLASALDATETLLAPKAAADGVTLALADVDRAAPVAMSAVSLQRCLRALVTNAISHTPRGGQVTVAVADRGADFITVTVADTGTGITGIDPARVFDRFASGSGGRDQSHGIGLALVKDAVTRCGGTVAVHKSDAGGTTFALRLPRTEKEH